MLCSIVLASHTFIWPTQDYEYQELGHTLLQLTGMLVAVGGCTVVLARYFPSLPLFNRLILKPEPWTTVEVRRRAGQRSADGYESLAFLIGETGRTTTPLRPTGKARFGSLLLDVTAGDRFVDPDSLIEVVDVQGLGSSSRKSEADHSPQRKQHDHRVLRASWPQPLADLHLAADHRDRRVRADHQHLPRQVLQALDPGQDDPGQRHDLGAGRDVVPQGEPQHHGPLEDHGLPGRPVREGRHDDPGTRGPLSGRRQRSQRRPGLDRRQPRGYSALVQAGGGHRPGRAATSSRPCRPA